MNKIVYRFYSIVLFHLSFHSIVFGGQINLDSIFVKGHFTGNSRYTSVVVKAFGVGTYPVGVVPLKGDSFELHIPAGQLEPGVYRFQYSQSSLNEFVDIILDGKENELRFELSLLPGPANRVPVFYNSPENNAWYTWQREQTLRLKQIGALENLVQQYPVHSDAFYKKSVKELIKLRKDYRYAQLAFCKGADKTPWAARLVANTPVHFADAEEHTLLQKFSLHDQLWNEVNNCDTHLIHTPVFQNLIMEYVKFYMDPDLGFTGDESLKGFMASCDTIMARFSCNETVHTFALDYLTLGFKEIGQEKVLQYLDEKYRSAIQCKSSEKDLAFEKRMKGYELYQRGTPAPEILFGENGNLKSIPEDTLILVFWAGWCPHCSETLPALHNWLKGHTGIKVVAVSLDDDPNTWSEAIKNYPDFLHYCDFSKWESKPVTDYYISGTPTFVVLDKERKILEKYISYESLLKAFQAGK